MSLSILFLVGDKFPCKSSVSLSRAETSVAFRGFWVYWYILDCGSSWDWSFRGILYRGGQLVPEYESVGN